MFGEPVYYQPLGLKLVSLALLIVFVGLVVILATLKFKDTQIVRGYLEPNAGEVKVYGGRSGAVENIFVKNGQEVKKGDVLVVLTPLVFGESGSSISQSKLKELDEQIAYLKELIDLTKSRHVITKSTLETKIEGGKQEIEILAESQKIIKQRLEITREEMQKTEKLMTENVVAKSEYNQKKASYLSIAQMFQGAQQEQLARENVNTELQQELLSLPVRHQEDIANLKNSLARLRSERIELESQGAITVVAPVNGTISNLDVSTGDYLIPQTPIVTILPKDYSLEANLFMPSRALGAVEVGQEIMIFYDAYPYQTYGFFPGKITDISQTVTDPREYLVPVAIEEPFYRVKAEVNYSDSKEKISLRSGMQFSAEVITAHESLLDRLFEPFKSVGTRL
ncbi:HlyD family secretion protein [Aurantivibrio plasticivorans]